MKKLITGLFVFLSIFAVGVTFSASDCVCTMQYDPVCGVDGKTYGNACGLGCAGVQLDYVGECGQQVDSIPNDVIESTCVSRFDGCNTCTVQDGQLGACTKMACFTMQKAKCLQHEFTVLKPNHELIIKNVILKHLLSFTDTQKRDQAINTLLSKVEKKRAEINYTLSVSKFAVGSSALRTYQLFLEVLTVVKSVLM